ncbi:MAG TPA: DUF2818 family protein [Aquabacterium sp.]|nr:DUF2818 family protein [Aquabacterium sp.]
MPGLVPLWSVVTVLFVTVLLANLPFVNDRIFVLGPRRAPKSIGWRLIELLLVAALTAVMGRALEGYLGQVSPLRWEFVAVWLCVVATFAFPGFVWRYLRRH